MVQKHNSFFAIFIWKILISISPILANQFGTIDLNKIDVYLKKGFSEEWLQSNPVGNPSWIKIPKNETGSRSLSIQKLNPSFLQGHTYLDFSPRPATSFTFHFPIELTTDQAKCYEGVGVGLVGIAYNWQIYFNGVLIDDFFKGIKDGELIQPRRGKRHIVPISNHLLKPGLNYLTLRTIGSPDFLGTGLYYAKPYQISSLAVLMNTMPLRYYQFGLVWLYTGIGFFWLYMFLRLPNIKHYLYFMGWALTIAGYNLARVDYLTPMADWGLFTFRLEYFAIYMSSFCFMGFVQQLLFKRITLPAKILMTYFAISAITSMFFNIGVMNDLFRVWQLSIPIPMALLIWQTGSEVHKMYQSQDSDHRGLFIILGTTPGSLIVGMVVLFIFLGIDIISSLFFNEFSHFNLLGFLFFTLIISVIAFSDFIQHHTETEAMKDKLESEVNKRTKEIRNLSSTLMYAQENERKKLSQELHDEIGQSLTIVNLNLHTILQNPSMVKDELQHYVKLIQSVLNETSETLREFSFTLRPTILDDLGLVPAMKAHAEKFTNRTQINVIFKGENHIIENDKIKIALYRVFQESLTNVAKHSDAEDVSVVFEKSTHYIDLTILDQGQGFDESSIIPNKGLGLLGMKERIEGVGGIFSFNAFPGEGVTISARVPINSLNS